MLTISIPTFNRSNRLGKNLHDLLREILLSKNKKNINVYISDNGSPDDTALVVKKYSAIYNANLIPMTFDLWPENRGFDENIICCYEHCTTEYLWFLSDDDNVIPGAIDLIIHDIKTISANVLFYNFNQSPYGLKSPLMKEKILYFTCETHEAISKIIHWPKLSSIVIKKGCGKSGANLLQLSGADSQGFMHVALALQTVFDDGKLLLSNNFIAYPDTDYMDQINFTPYIFNCLNVLVYNLFYKNGKEHLYPALGLRKVNPLNHSLLWLSKFYLGAMVLTPSLRDEMSLMVKKELQAKSFLKSKPHISILAMAIFCFAYIYYYCRKVLTGKDVSRLRI